MEKNPEEKSVKRLFKFIALMERLGLGMAALALLGLLALGSVEMMLRTFFDTGLSISLEYSGYLVAIAFLGGSGWTLADGGHIRVQFLEDKLGDKWRRTLSVLTTGIALVVAVILITGLVTWTAGSFWRGTVSFYPSATPLWWPQALLSLAALILGLSIFGQFLQAWQGGQPPPQGPEGTQ